MVMECPVCREELDVGELLLGFDDEFDCPDCGSNIEVILRAPSHVREELEAVRGESLHDLTMTLFSIAGEERAGEPAIKESMTDDEQRDYGIAMRRLALKLVMVPHELHHSPWPTLGRSLRPALELFKQGTRDAIRQGNLAPVIRAAVEEMQAPIPSLWLERVWDIIPGTAWKEPPEEGRRVYSAAVLAYLRGNDLAAVGLARAALDVRVTQALADLGMGESQVEDLTFRKRLEWIRRERKGTKQALVTQGVALWNLGNGTLHAGEIGDGDAVKALGKLATVLESLARKPAAKKKRPGEKGRR